MLSTRLFCQYSLPACEAVSQVSCLEHDVCKHELPVYKCWIWGRGQFFKSLLCAEELGSAFGIRAIVKCSPRQALTSRVYIYQSFPERSWEHNLIAKPGQLAHLLTIHGNCPACLHNVVVLQACSLWILCKIVIGLYCNFSLSCRFTLSCLSEVDWRISWLPRLDTLMVCNCST